MAREPSTPEAVKSDLQQAREVLRREPQNPVGLLLGKRTHAQLVARGARFPCPVAVDPLIHPEHEQWFYLEANFQPFTALITP